jgi:hypothetical protein
VHALRGVRAAGWDHWEVFGVLNLEYITWLLYKLL